MNVVIVYHSGYGHTEIVARHIAKGLLPLLDSTMVLSAQEATLNLQPLNDADMIVFGSPTYFGNVSAEFKKFMEATSGIWSRQLWRNKLAAGFTNSSSRNGDKLATLTSLALFAAQHGMMWVPLGILPEYDEEGYQKPEVNAMASYLGLMTMSPNNHRELALPNDLVTAEMFGSRLGRLLQSRHFLTPHAS
jgi:NAD(P)H dehydrogenase (quinone)